MVEQDHPSEMCGKTLLCPDGPLGPVFDVLTDPETARPTHLVWREGVVLTREISIPIEYIELVEGNRILLRANREELTHLPQIWW